MAQYTVKAPDGKEITLEGPEGASEQQVIAIAQQLYKPEAPSGIAMGLKDLVAGGGQAIARGVETLAEKIGYEPAIAFLKKERQKYEDTIKKEEEQYQAQRKAAGETGIDWGRIGGNVINPINYVGGAVTSVPRLLTMGAIQGAATPVYDEAGLENFGMTKLGQAGEGAVAAGLFGAGAKAVKGAYNTARDVIAPMTQSGRERIAREFVQSTVPPEVVPQVQAALRNPNVYVEGSVPTMGEAVSNIPGAANLAALQAKIATTPEAAPIFAAREAERELARANAVARLGGEFVPEAVAMRAVETTPMREAALAAAKPIQAESLASALETVANSKAYKGSGLAEDSLKYFANAFRDAASDGVVTPEALYNIRKRVGQDIQGLASQRGISSLDATAIKADTSIKKIIDNAIEATGGKGWKDYLTAFEQQSTKIDRMKVGQYLQETLGGKFNAENAGAFALAIDKAPETLKKSTGIGRYKELQDLLTKDEVKLLSGIKDDLTRENTYKELAKKSVQGSKFADGEAIPHFLNRMATITNYALRVFNKNADKEINKTLAEMPLEKWAALFDAVPPNKAEAWVKSVFPRLTPEVRSKAMQTIGLMGAEAVTRETGKPNEPIQQRQVQPIQPQSKTQAVNVIAQAAQQYGKPELTSLLSGIAKVESNFDPNAKSKKSTAAGMFQFTKATQKDYGLTNPYDAAQSAGAAAAYIDKLLQRYKGDKVKALAAYNQGPGVIDKGLNKAGREYAMKVLAATRNI